MGNLYSHLVFRPPPICSYQSHNGLLQYIYPTPEGLPHVHSTPIIWLLNNLHFRIPCVIISPPNASDYFAIYAHQNGEDLGSAVIDAHMLAYGMGVRVLAFEYSGYGLSERPRIPYPSRFVFANGVKPSLEDDDRKRAEPSEKACCSDITAAYAYLVEQCGIKPSNIILFGRSIGSGPAVYCASTKTVGGLVLISPIASAVRVPLKKLNFTLPFIDTFPNIDRAAKIKCPVLLVHGDMDEIVPKLHGERIFEKLKQTGNAVTPLWIPGANHNNVVEDFHSIVFGRYLTFLDELNLMKAARKSVDDAPRHRVFPQRQKRSDRKQTPRRQRPLSCLRPPPRISLENFSTCAANGDQFSPRDSRTLKAWKTLSPLNCLSKKQDITNPIMDLSDMGIVTPGRRSMSSPIDPSDIDIPFRPSLTSREGFHMQAASWDIFRKSMEQANRQVFIKRRTNFI